MPVPLSVHWIPAHRGSIGGRTDRDWLALWDPAFVKIVTNDETVPYLEDVPAGANIVVRNYPLSELGHDRGFAQDGTRAAVLTDAVVPQYGWTGKGLQQGSGRDLLVKGPGAFGSFQGPYGPDYRGLASVPEEVGREHAAICNRIAQWCETRPGSQAVPRERLWFEGLNEPMLWGPEPPAAVARYYRQFALSLHGYGLRGVLGNFGVGWPGNGGVADAPVQWDFWKTVVEVMDLSSRPDYLGLHEYWALNGVDNGMNGQPNMWRWWAGRYEQCPFRVPILITECGIDTGVTGRWYGGWGDLPGTMAERARRYVGELAWYWQRCKADGRIQGIFPFTFDRGSDTWVQFDLRNENWLRELTGRKAEFPAASWAPGGPVVDPPKPEPEPADRDAAIKETAWNLAGIPFNPDAAFQRFAAAQGLGVPMTVEQDVTVGGVTYRVQGYGGGIVYAVVGDWANVSRLSW